MILLNQKVLDLWTCFEEKSNKEIFYFILIFCGYTYDIPCMVVSTTWFFTVRLVFFMLQLQFLFALKILWFPKQCFLDISNYSLVLCSSDSYWFLFAERWCLKANFLPPKKESKSNVFYEWELKSLKIGQMLFRISVPYWKLEKNWIIAI